MNLIPRGHPSRVELDSIRDQIAKVREEIKQIERAPLTADETRERLRKALRLEIEKEQQAYRVRMFRSPRDSIFPDLPKGPLSNLKIVAGGEDRILDGWMEEIATDLEQRPGIAAPTRAQILDDRRATLRELERRDEQEVLKLQADRWDVDRRGDASVEILFAVWAEASPPGRVADEPPEPLRAPPGGITALGAALNNGAAHTAPAPLNSTK